MKILYIGHYRDGTGWGNAAINNILAMDSAGINVVPRAITYENKDSDYPEKIKQLEQQDSSDADICIQHTLPSLYTYNSKYKKNIGFLACETDNFKDTGWQYGCNIMDELWVPSLYSKGSCRLSGVTKPINVVPHSLDMSKYKTDENSNKIQELIPTYNFIFVGEFIERKNLKALLRAFHSEFETSEPVNLVVKTSKSTLENVQQYMKQLKTGLKNKKTYKNEIVICGRLNFEDYVSVISQCHSFVMPSRGEGFCIPALEAMALGLPVLYTSGIGVQDYAHGISVESHTDDCFGAVDTIPYLDNSNSSWKEISVSKLRFAMRSQYMKWKTEEALKTSQIVMEKALDYDHKKIGESIKEILNDS